MPEITGTAFDDVLTGTDEPDVINGLAGADVLRGGLGNDILTGGEGGDTFVYTSGAESLRSGLIDIITDFGSGDVLDLRGLNASRIDIAYVVPPGRTGSLAAYVSADTSSGRFQIYVDSATSVGLSNNLLTNGIRHFYGAIGSSAGVNGSSGADVVYGTPAGEFMFGGGGADVLFGGAGGDQFIYSSVADSTRTDYDFIADFQIGMDSIQIFSGISLTALSLVRTEAGATYLFIEAAQGPMTIAVQAAVNANDVLGLAIGQRGWTMLGSSLADVMVGAFNHDVIKGGAGDDIITGGGGADALFGGAGADVFRYAFSGDSTVAGADVIVDFTSGQDRLDLTAIRRSASDRFEIVQSGTGSLIWVDLNGDGGTDMMIQLADVRLTASDVIWG